MRGDLVGRTCRKPKAWPALALVALALLLPASASAQFGPPPTFAGTGTLNTQDGPQSIAVVDVDDDDVLDLVVANFFADNVSFFRGDGAGGFAAPVHFAVGDGPVDVAAGDVNRDGHLDIVTANGFSDNATVLLGNGSGGFTPAPSSPFAAEDICQGIAIGEVTGDAFVDILVVNTGSGSVSVLAGTGVSAGLFAPHVDYAVGAEPIEIALAQLNADGRLDVVVTNLNAGSAGSVSVLLGNASGTLNPATNVATGGNAARSVAVARLNGDAHLDLVVANRFGLNVGVLLGNGNGTFQAAVTYTVVDQPLGIEAGDFNADGKIDVAVTNLTGNGVTLLNGNGAGLLQAPGTFFATGLSPVAVGTGDFDADGKLDLAVNNIDADTITLLRSTLSGEADLSVAQTDGQTTETPGTTVTYTITVSNAGPDTLTQLTLTDTLPAALSSPVFTPGTGSYDSGTGAWTGIALASGGSVTMTLTGTISATASGNLVNSVTVATRGTDVDPDGTNNSATDTDTLVRSADLSVTKTDSQTTETPGTGVTYTIVVSNAGPSTLSQLTLTDTLPTALSSPVFTPGTGSYNSGTGAWTGITLASGGSVSMTLTGTISATASGNLVNSVTVATLGTDVDPNGTNNSATDTDTLVRSADLSVTKTDGQTTETPGTGVTYTIVVSNAGPSTLSQLTLTDTVPAALLTPVFTPGTGSYNSGTGAWTGITLASGGSVTMTLSGTISAAATGNLVNSVTVAAISTDVDPNGTNNSATDTDTLVPSTDVSISKTGPATVAPGQNVVYTISVTNLGPSNATGVSVADATPANLTFVSNSGDCTTAFLCNLGAMTVGQVKTITTTFTIAAGFPGATVSNTATVSSGTTDPASPNNSSTATSTISTAADLAVTKTGPVAATKGQNLVYTITVTNNGPADATTVSVADVTPTGLTFVSNAGDCVTTFPCALGLIAPGATRTITATFSVPASYAGPNPIVNTASVGSASADPDTSDNSASASSSLGGLAFYTLAPCRVLDTRVVNAPALAPGPARSFAIAGVCGVPTTAQAVSINVTATQPTDQGDLRVFPAGGGTPNTSTINYAAGQTRANNAVVKLGTSGAIAVVTGQASGTVHFILDVNGYFE